METTPRGKPLGKPINKDKNGRENGGEKEERKNDNQIRIGCWNIRRGLIRREEELKELLRKENLDIMFLVETDTRSIKEEKDYKIGEYKTVLPKQKDTETNIRIIGLIAEKISTRVKVRTDLMSEDFPSIWLELEREKRKKLIIGGFYREWRKDNDSSQEAQLDRIKILTKQMAEATKSNSPTIVMGDANLCMEKWEEEDYPYRNLSSEVIGTLARCGMEAANIGTTYLADRLTPDGEVIVSALDHIYISSDLVEHTSTKKSEESSTDHVPIIAEVKDKVKQVKENKIIFKRCMKEFTKEKWNKCLADKAWETLAETEDVEKMAGNFTTLITEALDECAPVRRFKVNKNYKRGLTKETKELIKERDKVRQSLKKSPGEKEILHKRYKRLRNRVTNAIRKDTIMQNGERIQKARREDEVWKVINDIIKPKEDKKWMLKEGDQEVLDEKEIAEIFNKHFIEKIESLKDNIDKTMQRNPTEKLKEKVKNLGLRFTLKTVTEKKVKKAMDDMKKKKSAGLDGISQECLLMGSDIIAVPLTRIINTSIQSGIFPEEWKTAVVTPILKKGDQNDKTNYRPVSCLAAASKVLEKIVCQQITKHLETNSLLPDSQHGFREKRSTMTALSEIQRDWTENTENKMITGVLFWDLSAAFDTLNIDLLTQKLKLYGATMITCKWFNSFLTGRYQMVKIGKALSTPRRLESGVPQGGILSPIIFTIYCADLEEWVTHSKLLNYADDTSSSLGDKEEEVVKTRLKEDAYRILEFMASNGLVANPTKTEFLLINSKEKERVRTITVGEAQVQQVRSAKLLGITMDDTQKWSSHFWGKKGLLSSLNQRLFTIRRISRHIPRNKMKHIVSSIWTSKLRYGLQLTHKVRTQEDDRTTKDIRATQVAQNDVLRLLDGSRRRDRKSIKDMLDELDMLSVNQTAAQIKLQEAWKANNDEDYPIKMVMKKEGDENEERDTRRSRMKMMVEGGKTLQAENSFTRDAGKLWNRAPAEIKRAKNLETAKKEIKKYCKTLPI